VEILFLVGRIVFGLYLLYNAYNHFRNLDGLAGYAAMKGIPAPQAMTALSGLLLVVGGASILSGFEPVVGVGAVALFLVPVTLMMHAFWAAPAEMAGMEKVQFMKNAALLGAALMLLAIPQPWPLALGR